MYLFRQRLSDTQKQVNYIAGIKLNYVDITSGGVENSGSITVSAKAEVSSYDDASLDEIHGLLISDSNIVGNISNEGTITISERWGRWFFCTGRSRGCLRHSCRE